jgi:hypothetical protein
LRKDLLANLRSEPGLQPLDSDLRHLLGSWFNRGFLELRRIDWQTPAAVLEKLHSRSIQERGSGRVAGLAVDGVTDAMLILPHALILPTACDAFHLALQRSAKGGDEGWRVISKKRCQPPRGRVLSPCHRERDAARERSHWADGARQQRLPTAVPQSTISGHGALRVSS